MKDHGETVCQGCGEESEYAAHGIRNCEVYNEAWCAACWASKGRITLPVVADEALEHA